MFSLSATMSKHSLYENLLPTFVGPTLTVSDLSKTAKFGEVRSYEEHLTVRNLAFVSFRAKENPLDQQLSKATI